MYLKVLIVLLIMCIVMCLCADSYGSPTTYYNRRNSRRSTIYGNGSGGKTSRDQGTRYKGRYPSEGGGYGGRGYGASGSSQGVGKTYASGYGGYDTSNGIGFGSIGGSSYGSGYNPGYSGSRGGGKTTYGGGGKTTYGGRGRGGNKGGGRKYPPITQRKTPTGGKGISTTVQQRKMGYRQRDH